MRSGSWDVSRPRRTRTTILTDAQAYNNIDAAVETEVRACGGNPFAADAQTGLVTTAKIALPQRLPLATKRVPLGAWDASRNTGDTWPPPKGADCIALVDDGEGQEWTLINGVFDAVPASLLEDEQSVTVTSRVDDLSRRVKTVPRAYKAPTVLQLLSGGTSTTPVLRPGMSIEWLIDALGAQIGWETMYKPGGSDIVRASMLGSLHCDVGGLVDAHREGAETAQPSSVVESGTGRVGSAWFEAAYRPSRAGVNSFTLVWNLFAQDSTGIWLDLLDTAGVGIRLEHDGVDRVKVSRWQDGSGVTLFGPTPRRESQSLTLEVVFQGSNLYRLQLTLDGQERVETTISLASWALHQVNIKSFFGGRTGGLRVTDSPGAPGSRSARLNIRAAAVHNLWAHPKMDRSFLDFFTEVTRLLGADAWLSPGGVLHWRGRGFLDSNALNPYSGQEFSTRLEVDDVEWSDELASVRGSISVDYKGVALDVRNLDTVRLNTASNGGGSIDPGDEQEIWVQPPADEDWIQPDRSWEATWSNTEKAEWTEGSWLVATRVPDDQTKPETTDPGSVSWEWSWITEDTCLVTAKCGSVPSGYRTELRSPRNWRRQEPTPMLRGKGKIVWADLSETVSTGRSGPGEEIDGSYWLSINTMRNAWLDDMKRWASTTLPSLGSVTVAFDPRTEVGDKVYIFDPDLVGVRITLVVLGIQARPMDDVMTLSGRVVWVTPLGERPIEQDYLSA